MDFIEEITGSPSKHSSCSTETTEDEQPSSPSDDFGDGACGEPLQPQHLTIDFTPIDDIDNDFVQRKCCAFWKFIRSQPGIKHLMKLPEANMFTQISNSSESEDLDEKPNKIVSDKKPPASPTAVSILGFVEEKGLIDRAFEAKMPQLFCELGSRVYDDETEVKRTAQCRQSSKETICSCIGECKTCKMEKTSMLPRSPDPEVRVLCDKMKKWDVDHPKSMEPPGHPPSICN